MINTEFIRQLESSDNISDERFADNIAKLVKIAATDGLNDEELKDVAHILLTVKNIEKKAFNGLLLCLIPQSTVPVGVVQKIVIWVLKNTLKYCVRTKNLLTWIATLLDINLIDREVVNDFYNLIWHNLVYYPETVCHILFILTKSHDVTAYRVHTIQSLIEKEGQKPYLCLLLSRFKELNSEFEDITIPRYKISKNIFGVPNLFHKKLLLFSVSRRTSLPISQSLISHLTDKSKEETCDSLVPRIQFLPDVFQDVEIEDITNGKDFVMKFDRLKKYLNPLSLLNDANGLRVLIYSSKSVQEQFMNNLCAVLKQKLISRQNVNVREIEGLLDKIEQLHIISQQGFNSISKTLMLYLQSWDGEEYKMKIYQLLEWFMFESNADLNRFLFLPLFSIYVSSPVKQKCDILNCLINFLVNLYPRIVEESRATLFFSNEDVLPSSQALKLILKSVTKFISKLIELGLNIHPCDNHIIYNAITFYEKVHYFERKFDVDWWTLISSNALYHTLFSFNAQLLNDACYLLTNYVTVLDLPIAHATSETKEKAIRLKSYIQDIYNFLRSNRAFVDRMSGHIFKGLSIGDESIWIKHINMNNSLSLLKHIMFAPHRMAHGGDFTDEAQMLDLLSGSPYNFNGIIDLLKCSLIVRDPEDVLE